MLRLYLGTQPAIIDEGEEQRWRRGGDDEERIALQRHAQTLEADASRLEELLADLHEEYEVLMETFKEEKEAWESDVVQLRSQLVEGQRLRGRLEARIKEAELERDGLQRQMCELRSIRVGKELERVMIELGQIQTIEHLNLIKQWPRDDLALFAEAAVIAARNQQGEMRNLEEELRLVKVELEQTLRKLRNQTLVLMNESKRVEGCINEPKGIPRGKRIKITNENVTTGNTTEETIGDEKSLVHDNALNQHFSDLSSSVTTIKDNQSFVKRPHGLLQLPPKFNPIRYQGTVSDGCGGQRKVSKFNVQ